MSLVVSSSYLLLLSRTITGFLLTSLRCFLLLLFLLFHFTFYTIHRLGFLLFLLLLATLDAFFAFGFLLLFLLLRRSLTFDNFHTLNDHSLAFCGFFRSRFHHRNFFCRDGFFESIKQHWRFREHFCALFALNDFFIFLQILLKNFCSCRSWKTPMIA